MMIRESVMADLDRNQEIRIDKIPVRGGIGSALVIALLAVAMMVELPMLRWLLVSSAVGLLMGAFLVMWRSR
jgi:hypothetical protein